MRVFAYVRRGARAGVCVLALGVIAASAQQPSSDNPHANNEQSAPAVTPSDTTPAATEATPPASTAQTSNLPELVINDDGKKKKKVVKKKQEPVNASSTTDSQAATAEPPPPGVTLFTGAPSDTGTTTFSGDAVRARTTGNGDANTFLRNLPNVQYQNMGDRAPGATSQSVIDTKPQAVSISGGRTYENNFIINGVSVSNITGPATNAPALTDTSGSTAYGTGAVVGMSAQNIYVPADFVGQATVIDSNASAEYGQFTGGVVVYDLVAPPTDRYHATVSATRETSDMSSYILATPTGTNTSNRLPPTYEKTNLSASVGAPITSDFAFIMQASRKEAESSKQYAAYISNAFGSENSDNVFLRFAATAKTDIGKFTFDTSRTDYYQHWFYYQGRDMYLDVNTLGTTTKLEHETAIAGLRVDDIGLGRAKLKSRVFYNTSDTQNNSAASVLYRWAVRAPSIGFYNPTLYCPGLASSTSSQICYEGGYGDTVQSQTDYGVQSTLTGDLMLGNFKVGAEAKHYEGRQARLQNLLDLTGSQLSNAGLFVCGSDPYCNPYQYTSSYSLYPAYDSIATVDAFHTFAEIDQTWAWFNVRAGVRYDYDDYFKNNNVAPRIVGTFRPIEELSFTAGYNRYYLGETLYYAVRERVPGYQTFSRSVITSGTPDSSFSPGGIVPPIYYRGSDLATPYDDEYSAAVSIKDPLLGGQMRLKYLERYGDDQFATVSCGNRCYQANNDGDKFYRSATAEYTKQWARLNTPFFLNAAAVTGNVTWEKQRNSKNNYLLNNDFSGDGTLDTWIYYNKHRYSAQEFTAAVNGNLDIPVRFGAALNTSWFDGVLELNANASVSLGFAGVYESNPSYNPPGSGCSPACKLYEDRLFTPTLKLDLGGQINVTEQAAIVFNANNVTNSAQNAIALPEAPWVLGRSFWLGSALRF
jgi:hypothetical protein